MAGAEAAILTAGPTGPRGSTGPNGKPGASNIIGVQKLTAGTSCANGGWRISTTLGSYNLCNGSNGNNAAGGS